jgi:hypothetical protein
VTRLTLDFYEYIHHFPRHVFPLLLALILPSFLFSSSRAGVPRFLLRDAPEVVFVLRVRTLRRREQASWIWSANINVREAFAICE